MDELPIRVAGRLMVIRKQDVGPGTGPLFRRPPRDLRPPAPPFKPWGYRTISFPPIPTKETT